MVLMLHIVTVDYLLYLQSYSEVEYVYVLPRSQAFTHTTADTANTYLSTKKEE